MTATSTSSLPVEPSATSSHSAPYADLHLPTAGRVAVVTGASAGIGEATARLLAHDAWVVILCARRAEALDGVAAAITAAGGQAQVVVVDITDEASVASAVERIAEIAPNGVDLLVNNAGGARGLEPILDTDPADWRWMYEANVMGTLAMTRSLFPALERTDAPQVINVVSVAGRGAYRNGAGYNAAKFAETALTDVMRMEFAERGVRVCQVDPGRVATEFSLNRFKGDQERADAVYADVENLLAQDIGEAIRWIAARPRHMDVESIMIRPIDQV